MEPLLGSPLADAVVVEINRQKLAILDSDDCHGVCRRSLVRAGRYTQLNMDYLLIFEKALRVKRIEHDEIVKTRHPLRIHQYPDRMIAYRRSCGRHRSSV